MRRPGVHHLPQVSILGKTEGYWALFSSSRVSKSLGKNVEGGEITTTQGSEN
jgi:hypothetical protein